MFKAQPVSSTFTSCALSTIQIFVVKKLRWAPPVFWDLCIYCIHSSLYQVLPERWCHCPIPHIRKQCQRGPGASPKSWAGKWVRTCVYVSGFRTQALPHVPCWSRPPPLAFFTRDSLQAQLGKYLWGSIRWTDLASDRKWPALWPNIQAYWVTFNINESLLSL